MQPIGRGHVAHARQAIPFLALNWLELESSRYEFEELFDDHCRSTSFLFHPQYLRAKQYLWSRDIYDPLQIEVVDLFHRKPLLHVYASAVKAKPNQ